MNRQRRWTAVLAAAETCNNRRCRMKATGMSAIGRISVAAMGLVLALIGTAPQVMAAERNWKTDADSGAWGTPGNWVENAVPGNADDVFFTTWSGGTAVSYTTFPQFRTLTYSGAQDFSLTSGDSTFGMYGTNIAVTGGSGNITLQEDKLLQLYSTAALTIRNDSSGLLTLPRIRSYGIMTGSITYRDVLFTGSGDITISSLGFRGGTYKTDVNLVKSGSGTLTVLDADIASTGTEYLFGGKTTINGGTVVIGGENCIGKNPAALAADHLKLDGGTLRTTASFAIDDSNRGITLGSGGGTFSVDSSTTLTVGNPITGAGGLVKAGAGTLVLAAENDYTGNTTVNGGTVVWNNACLSASADLICVNAPTIQLDYEGNNTIRRLYVNGKSQPLGVYNAGNAPAGLTITGDGALEVTDAEPPRGTVISIN